MEPVTGLNKMAFHDASIDGITRHDNAVSMLISDYNINNIPYDVKLFISNVESVKENDKVVDNMTMQGKWGEILDFDEKDGIVNVLIWG